MTKAEKLKLKGDPVSACQNWPSAVLGAKKINR
jgi:hypothetical protein